MATCELEKSESKKLDVIFRDLNADDPEVTEIESLCLQCNKNGITRMLLTKIPFYKEVVVMSFSCDHCLWENNSLQPASKIQDQGVLYKLKVLKPKDLSRVVVKTDWASITIPELEFEIPSQSQEGTITTVEGVIERTCLGLNSKIEQLQKEDPDSAEKLAEFLLEINKLKDGNHPFTFALRDCSGNSFLQSLSAPNPDPQLEISYFAQSHEECLMMGLNDSEETVEGGEEEKITEEVLGLPTNCYSCNAPCVTNMKVTEIPHFENVIIWSTNCEACGHKTTEVKSSSGIRPLGSRAILSIKEHKDLTRDLLKSDTCSISIKELDLEAGPAAFRSCYSTVEGILTTIKEQLIESNPFISGDSADLIMRGKLDSVLNKIDEIIKGERQATLVLDDPCGNSCIQGLDDESCSDDNLIIEQYERTMEQDEELGLLDMKVENYEES
ncbi:zinc finger protein ZPR1 [Parasteatoda tepidariorum]|nr:zinc finger protein ZPR1 [Parasteatoda tepidariorum]